jgi:hypothetical protein
VASYKFALAKSLMELSAREPSVITSKPAISYHFKTGQRNHAQD